MIQKNILIAFRNILKNKSVSIINILGLAIGMMVVLLIFQYISFEKSYNRFFENADRLQRLVFYRYYKTGLDKSVGNNFYIVEIAAAKIPEIEKFCRCKRETQLIQAGEQIFKEERTLWADSSYFDMFSHLIIAKDKTGFLRSPDVVVITESTARKYFGNDNPVGKIIYTVNPGKNPVTILGVIRDVPGNSHLKFDIAISLWPAANKSYCYACNNTNTYFLLRKGADPVKIAREITDLAKGNFASRDLQIDFPIEFHLQPIADIHLHSRHRFEFEANGNSKYLSILLIIALLILITAGFNYFNLYSSVTGKRIKSIGIRIINGAKVSEILYMLNRDIILIIIISYVIAVPVIWYSLHKWLQSFAYRTDLSIWLFVLAGLISLGIAFFTVSWQSWKAATRNPVEALRYE
jgi:putative ABC transport system permease protein